MKKIILISFLVVHSSYCGLYDAFKNCSQVDFCSTLRTREPSDDYSVDPNSVRKDNTNVLTATLNHKSANLNLTLSLTLLKENSFRLKITEADSSRYKLKDILVKEPAVQDFDMVPFSVLGFAVIIPKSNPNRTLIVLYYSPFSITFQDNQTLNNRLVFNGDLLSFNTNKNTPFSFGVTFPQAYQLYGLHEHCEKLALRTTKGGTMDPYRLKNLDVAYYKVDSPMALYGSVPVLYGHGPDATTGVFLHNSAEQWIETNNNNKTGSEAYFMVETGILDLFIMLGPTPKDVVRQYTALTGTAPIPPLWSLGYHQSRYSYMSQDEVKEIVTNFTTSNFPLDSIWLDIDYTDGYRYFTWNDETFSDPEGLQRVIARVNKKLVVIIDPQVKREVGYSVYDEGLAKGYFIKSENGSDFVGPSWPGLCTFLDFLNPGTQSYYSSLYSYENFPKSTSTIAGIWNGQNEPSVFDISYEMTLPGDALHFGNTTHKEIHNIYGFLHSRATYQGLLQRDDNQIRPFVLTRSHFAGSQRYAAIWTGDNEAQFMFLQAAIQQCLNANMLGIVFCGADVGGFLGDPNAENSELFPRWYQVGAWLPFYRSHSTKDTKRREPYALPEDIQPLVKKALDIRYRHIPTWYTLFYKHSTTGDPIIRPLFYQYPEDVNVYKIDDQFLVGSNILVCAIIENAINNLDIYFPGGANELWLSIYDENDAHAGGNISVSVNLTQLPVYYKRGSIIVTKETVRQSTTEMANDSYTLHIARDLVKFYEYFYCV